MYMCHRVHVELRGQLVRFGSFLSIGSEYRTRVVGSDGQAPIATELSRWLVSSTFELTLVGEMSGSNFTFVCVEIHTLATFVGKMSPD